MLLEGLIFMKSIAILLLCLSFSVFADDLAIVDAQMGCIDKNKDAINDPFKYRYGVELIIKNISDSKVTLLTKIDTVALVPEPNSTKRVLHYSESSRIGAVIIPPKENLKLVELFPGDQTIISHQFSDTNFIEKSSFEYYSKLVYGGRFNNWIGRLQSKEIHTQVLYKCKT